MIPRYPEALKTRTSIIVLQLLKFVVQHKDLVQHLKKGAKEKT